MQLTKAFETKLTAEPGERAVIARITTTSVDREGDVVLPSGINLSNFRKNPVVLFAHRGDQLPVARAEKIDKQSDSIVAKVEFAERPKSLPSGVEWIPDTLFELFQQKVLRGFSIGFNVGEGGWRDATDADRRKFDGARRVIAQWELVEFSVAPIPMNQDALAMAVSKSWCSQTVAETLGWDSKSRSFTINNRRPELTIVRVPAPRVVRLDRVVSVA